MTLIERGRATGDWLDIARRYLHDWSRDNEWVVVGPFSWRKRTPIDRSALEWVMAPDVWDRLAEQVSELGGSLEASLYGLSVRVDDTFPMNSLAIWEKAK